MKGLFIIKNEGLVKPTKEFWKETNAELIGKIDIDICPNSPTFIKYVSVILNDQNKNQLFIPRGFGHVFLTLSEHAIVSYKVDNYYNKEFNSGIRYDDKN